MGPPRRSVPCWKPSNECAKGRSPAVSLNVCGATSRPAQVRQFDLRAGFEAARQPALGPTMQREYQALAPQLPVMKTSMLYGVLLLLSYRVWTTTCLAIEPTVTWYRYQ